MVCLKHLFEITEEVNKIDVIDDIVDEEKLLLSICLQILPIL